MCPVAGNGESGEIFRNSRSVSCYPETVCLMIRTEKEGFPLDQQKFGVFLRQLRREKGMTQEQLAERLCVSNRSISRWETGVIT